MLSRISSRNRIAFAACALAGIVLFHAQLLCCAAYPLISSDQSDINATHLLFLRSARNSDAAFEFAADFVNQLPEHRVLVMRDYVRRAEAIGATPSFLEKTIDMLEERGIPRDRIRVLGDGSAMTPAEMLEQAASWLKRQEPDGRMFVVMDYFGSGEMTDLADVMLDADERQRVRILGFSQFGIDETNWWRSRQGLKVILRNYLRLIHSWVFEQPRPRMTWDPDAYEESLQRNDG